MVVARLLKLRGIENGLRGHDRLFGSLRNKLCYRDISFFVITGVHGENIELGVVIHGRTRARYLCIIHTPVFTSIHSLVL